MEGGVNGCLLGGRLFLTMRSSPLEFMTGCTSPSLEASTQTPTSQYESEMLSFHQRQTQKFLNRDQPSPPGSAGPRCLNGVSVREAAPSLVGNRLTGPLVCQDRRGLVHRSV